MSSSFSEGQPLLLQAIERNPLTIAPDTLVVEAIAQINAARSSYTPIAQQQKLLGIFTERDIVRLTANETPLEGITISQVMTQNLITADCTMSEVQPFGAKECNSGTLKGAAIAFLRAVQEKAAIRYTISLTEAGNIFSVLALLRSAKIRHLPVTDDAGNLLGAIAAESLRTILQPSDLLKMRQVADVMVTNVLTAAPHASVFQIAQLMASDRQSCVGICTQETSSNNPVSSKKRR